MARPPINLLHAIRRLAGDCRGDTRHDAELLAAFANEKDEGAFTALVARHGRQVWAQCVCTLGQAGASNVDDCFQAVFIALARKARAVAGVSLPSWLAETARRTALEARRREARRQARQRELADHLERPQLAEGQAGFDGETARALREELDRLPDRLRTPVVLYYLEGRTQAQAAAFLGCEQGVVSRRLNRALDVLRQRLESRGLAVASATLATWFGYLATTEASLLPHAGTFDAAVKAAVAVAAGSNAGVSPAAVELAAAVLRSRVSAWWLVAGGVLALAGTGLAVLPGGRHPPPDATPGAGAESQKPVAEVGPSRPTAELSGRVVGPDGNPIPHADVSALIRQPWVPGRRGREDAVVSRGTADAQGRYRLAVPTDLPSWHVERRVTLLAHAPGHAPMTAEVVLRGQAGSADIRVPARAAAHGQLVGPDRKPASGVRVAVVRLGRAAREVVQGEDPPPPPPGWPGDVTTDADGRFRVEGLPAGETVWLQVQDDRYALETFSAAAASDPVTVTLTEGRLLTARVIAADTRRPLPGTRVSAVAGSRATLSVRYTPTDYALNDATSVPATELSALADADGRVRLRLPPESNYLVFAYPPDGEPYVMNGWKVAWSEVDVTRRLSIKLSSGVEVTGRVVEADGRPVAGACLYNVPPLPRPTAAQVGDMVTFRDLSTVTRADGRFRIVVPRGKSHLEVLGPSSEYRPQSFDHLPCHYCTDDHLVRVFEHAFRPLDLAAGGRPDPVQITLHRGTTVAGRVTGPDGGPARDGVAVCRAVVHPLRSPVPRMLPVRDGTFELPGCVPGRIYPVLLLDAARRLAAVADVRVPAPGEPPPVVRMAECGAARVRLVDAAGHPLAGRRPLVRVRLPLDRPAAENWSRPDPIYASWFDPLNLLSGLVTDADGVVTIPTLVPGLEYRISFAVADRWMCGTNEFRVTPGQEVRLPDVVCRELGRDAEADRR
jgi:RNA polymerase sigma factor (sigma-70 family)